MTDGDDDLIERLRRIAGQADPVPPALLDAARAAFGMRDIDARVAELVRDSAVDAPATSLRGDGPRLLSFEAGGAVIECEVTDRGARRDVVGQLVGAAADELEAQVTGNPAAAPAVRLSEHGVFAVRGLPAGPFRLRCHMSDGTTLVTSWASI
jgi:hypothetical protein